MKGQVFHIQRFTIQDGPGIRTTVFLKGCPLQCQWCHNPESQSPEPMLQYIAARCVGCGVCVVHCPRKCHILETKHLFVREYCIGCGACAAACPTGALEMVGRQMDVKEVMQEVYKDRSFYQYGGGITLSGGEPLFQPGFTKELLETARQAGIHTCVETSGFAPFEYLEDILPYTDIFLYDWKETDELLHRQFTGASNRLIAENLQALSERGACIVLRCPIIPTYNDRPEHLNGIADLAARLPGIVQVDILPYHVLGKDKYTALGRCYELEGLTSLSRQQAEIVADTLREKIKKPVFIR